MYYRIIPRLHSFRPARTDSFVLWVAACWAFSILGACTGNILDKDARIRVPFSNTSPAVRCDGPQCVCSPDFTKCETEGVCTNLTIDPKHCGECGRDCSSGGACVNGVCVCASGLEACAGSCANTLNDGANCGSCGHACASGQQCRNGECTLAADGCTPPCSGGQLCLGARCSCPDNQGFCDGSCVDTQTTPAHCGGCDKPCGSGQVCAAGKCACQAGQTTCGNACVDLQTSQQNCGSCGKTCAQGEVCMAGVCRGPSGADGCNGSAREITVREISIYQSVKIPIMQKGAAIAPEQRVAAVVQGRQTLFRVFVDLGSAYSAREISARLTLINSGSADQYFSKQTINKASSDSDTASTFQIFVPPEQIQADTQYSVELVECSSGATGSVAAPRFPTSGESALSTRKTGTLKITLIPVQTNSLTPDTSDATLANYKAFLEAMYPIEKAELKVGTTITTDFPIDWNTMLEQIRSQRQTDRPAADQYYYGLVKPATSLRDYCRGGCTAGVGYVASATQASTRAAVGLAFGDEVSAATLAHEVGHNHGRNHAPCAPGNSISGVDSKYPYDRAALGSWGYDPRKRTFFDPSMTRDIMGYCDPKWISDYTYKGLVDRVATINGAALQLVDADSIAAYRALIVDARGPRWSQPFPEPDAPFGAPESADVLDIDNQPIAQVTVYRTWVGDGDGSTVLVPEPEPGWNAIKLSDALPLPFSAPITVPAPR